MRAIVKGAEPKSLAEYRALQPRTLEKKVYDKFGKKDELRVSLVTEQRGICCYCMQRIRPNQTSMKIEHWHAQNKHQQEQLTYGNMLGSCKGGEGSPPKEQHCDTRRGYKDKKRGPKDLKWNPADLAHRIETRIRYDPDGAIRSDDLEFNEQLGEEALNLNLPLLKRQRREALDAATLWWKKTKGKLKDRPDDDLIRKKIEKHKGGTGKLNPFSQVAVWWLEDRLKKKRQ